MSTDNSKILRNELNRSLFSQNLPVYTSQKIGQINPSICSFGIPSETQKLVTGQYYELKPLVQRLTTQIKANNFSALCYVKDLWHNWDKFIAKGKFMVRNGAFNVPYIEAQNEDTNYQLPFVFVHQIIDGFLRSAYGSCAKLYQPQYAERVSNTEGNKVPYNYHFYTQTGRFLPSAQDTDISSAIENIGWWIPRLVGDGYNSSGVNLRLIPTSAQRTDYEMFLNITDPSKVTLVKALYVYIYKSWAHKTNKTVSLDDTFGDYNTVSVGVSEYGGVLNYSIALVKNRYETATDRNNWDNQTFRCYAVSGSASDYAFSGAVTGLQNTNQIPQNYIEEVSGTITFKSDDGVLPLFVNDTTGWDVETFTKAVLYTILFDTPELLGRGSLMEANGHHLFESRTIYDILGSYADNYDNAALGFSPDATFSIFALSLLNGETKDNKRVNLLPYVAYQKIITERFLLPHQILSNNEGDDSTISDKVFDSPYYRNNLVPTVLYGQLTNDRTHDYFYTSTLYSTEGHEYCAGVARANFSPQIWHNCVGANQILTLFLARGGLMDMDVFNKIWQKQDRNLQDLLQTAEIAITDSDDVLQAKKFAITKALSRFSLFGQLDQMCTSVLENHFGISVAKSENHNSVALHKDKHILPTKDLFNTGGCVDQKGNSLPLGERTNIITYNIDKTKYFEVMFQDYGYFINLHWFSVPNVRQNVPNSGIHLFEKLSLENDTRFALQLSTFPEFQNTGDEMLKLSDVEAFADDVQIAWTNKNNVLKDGYAQMCGEFKDRFKRQIVTPYPSYRKSMVAPSLTYAYLQPTPFNFDLPLVDKYGAAFLIEFDNIVLKKSPMTKNGLTNIF